MQSWRIPFNFPGVLRRLGINVPGAAFELTSSVVPISLVDADIAIPASFLPVPFGTPASAGELAGPLSGTILADTGPLAAGSWVAQLILSNNSGSPPFRFGRRDSGNASYVWSQYFSTTALNTVQLGPLRVQLADQERLRIEVLANVAGTIQGTIFASRVSD